jgi:hypothetical protein
MRAVYVAFGQAQGYMELPPGSGNRRLLDVHGEPFTQLKLLEIESRSMIL